MADTAYDLLLDVKGLQCPLPLLKTKQTLGDMRPGQVLKVVTTDKTTRMTFNSYLKNSGDELLKIEEYEKELHHYIRKK
jgi:tRNA 2-thiouridine synthesizing protein A